MACLDTAQDVMICEVCNIAPLQKHCNRCDTSFCDNCITKHITSDISKPHEIVVYNMKNDGQILPSCGIHAKNCEMYCLYCDIPLCIKCLASGSHKNHDLQETFHILSVFKDLLIQEANELEQFIYPALKMTVSELRSKISKVTKTHDRLVTDIEQHGTEWHRQLDIIINRRKREAERMKTHDLNIFEKFMAHALNRQFTVYQTIRENKRLAKSNDVSQMKRYSSNMQDMRKIPTKYDFTPSTFKSQKISVLELDEKFGTITPSSIFPYAQQEKKTLDSYIFSTKNTGYKHQFNIVCSCPDEFWVSGSDRKIKRFHIQGPLKQAVSTTTGNYPSGITVTCYGDLIYSYWEDRSINRVRDGSVKKLFSLQDWIPGRVSSTASGDLLVSMYKDDSPKKVIRYTGFTFTEKHTVQFDRSGYPWFSEGIPSLFIDENRNGDLCASDNKAKQVVVITEAGKPRFRYKGNLSSRRHTFDPCGIVTDGDSKILVADYKNHCIHILNHSGQFLRFIDNIENFKPIDISIDINNVLYIADNTSGTVKRIEFDT